MTLEAGITVDIERISKTIGDVEIAASEPGFNQVPALAQFLSQFYTGLESCLEKKFKIAGIPLPVKDDRYHKAILTLAIQSNFIPPSCTDIIVDLLGFRHFARHGYVASFRRDEVLRKAADAQKAWGELKPLWESSASPADS